MARTITGTLNLPDTGPLANAAIWFTAKRNEATKILKGVSAVVTTDGSGNYSQSIEDGYYAVSIVYDEGSRRAPLGDVFIEVGDPITINALLAVNNSIADPTDAALQQLLADAQTARDEAVAAAASIEVMETLTDATPGRLMPVEAHGLGSIDNDLYPPDLTDTGLPAGFRVFTSSTIGAPPIGNPFGTVLINKRQNSNGQMSLLAHSLNLAAGNAGVFHREFGSAGSDSGWQRFYDWANILGTVSQSGGVPTGAIIERGSNANGEYVKFAGGTLICTVALTSSEAGDVTWTYPSSYIASPNVSVPTGTNSDDPLCPYARPPGTSSVALGVRRATGPRIAVGVRPIAIGRWF